MKIDAPDQDAELIVRLRLVEWWLQCTQFVNEATKGPYV